MHRVEQRSWRPDVQGLRAVAVLGVLLFHAGVPFLDGGFAGVDVFFVISGFLITGNLLREHRSTGRIALGRFALHRLVRLAPAAVATILVTVVAVRVFLPPLDLVDVRKDALASVFGVENLWLAKTGTDYLAAHTPSPLQQFWSLGVEEQFYAAWAVLLTALLAVRPLRRALPAVIATGVVLGFVVMLVSATRNGPWTFFGPQARAWELGVGASVAVLAARSRSRRTAESATRRRMAEFSSTVGLVAVVASFVVLDETTPFPGPATLLPVLGAALVVLPGAPTSPLRGMLGLAPLRWIGDRSYSLYLWHWPVLTVPALALDRELSAGERTLAVVLALALAWVGHAVLERRVGRWGRASGWRRPVVIAAAAGSVAALVLPLTALPALHGPETVAAPIRSSVLRGPDAPETVPANIRPSIAAATASLPTLYDDGCHADFAETAPRSCRFGSGPVTTVLFGDSHAAQWFSPLEHISATGSSSLVTLTKSSCPSVSLSVRSGELGRDYRECDAWRERAFEAIDRLRPELVVLSNAANGYRSDTDAAGWGDALRRTIERISGSGARVVVVGDTPLWTADPNRCLSASIDDVAHCAARTSSVRDEARTTAQRTAARAEGAVFVDPTSWLCGATCSPVLWNVLAYRDTNHVTDEMARTLEPRLRQALDAADSPDRTTAG